MQIQVSLIAGGVGSRFWPLSREAEPKQFLDILGTGRNLLQMTYERFRPLCETPYVLTTTAYAAQVQASLPQLPGRYIIAEPARRNTAAPLLLLALLLAETPDTILVSTPADHYIADEPALLRAVETAAYFAAEHDALLTLGITPQSPHTGYGYIHYDADTASDEGIYAVRSFTEKPDLERAISFLSSGSYLWNAGIFIVRVGHLLSLYQRHMPEMYALFTRYDLRTPEGLEAVYDACENIAFDYAVVEKTQQIYTLPVACGWSDVGSWQTLYQHIPHSVNGSKVLRANAILHGVSDSLIIDTTGQEKLIAVQGLRDVCIIHTDDVILVCPKHAESQMRQLRAAVPERFL